MPEGRSRRLYGFRVGFWSLRVGVDRAGFAGDLQPDDAWKLRKRARYQRVNRLGCGRVPFAWFWSIKAPMKRKVRRSKRLPPKTGCIPETLKVRVRQAERDTGARAGAARAERERRQANAILRKASAYFFPAPAV